MDISDKQESDFTHRADGGRQSCVSLQVFTDSSENNLSIFSPIQPTYCSIISIDVLAIGSQGADKHQLPGGADEHGREVASKSQWTSRGRLA